MGISNICVPVFLSLLDNIGACGNCYLSFGLTSQSAAKGDNGQSRALQKARNLVPLGITSVVIRKYWNDTGNRSPYLWREVSHRGDKVKGGRVPTSSVRYRRQRSARIDKETVRRLSEGGARRRRIGSPCTATSSHPSRSLLTYALPPVRYI